MNNIYLKLVVLAFSLFFAVGVFAMTLGNVSRVCLFSAISGTITLDGKPVANARLVRTSDRAGPKIDQVVTDADGHFAFPAMYEPTITKFLPQEFVVSQKIVVSYQGRKYEMWSSVKRNSGENTESRGKPLIVSCELNSEEQTIVIDRVPIHSLCVWNVEPDAVKSWDEL